MWTLSRSPRVSWLIVGICLALTGCHQIGHRETAFRDVARENNKQVLREYFISPPDVLVIDLVRAVPLPPYRIKALDVLFVQVKGTPPEDPIKGVYRVEPEGSIRFGPVYGSVPVVDLTIDEAILSIAKHLKGSLLEPQVAVSLEETRGVQLIRGEHLVRPDGTVNLGLYGRVLVTGLGQDAAKEAIENHLAKYFLKPSISLDISGFNSSVYYVIFDGGGLGEQVTRLPFTGSETVLDAIGQVYGLPAVASRSRVWVARPEEGKPDGELLTVDWNSITKKGRPETNYQLLPGDRIYVAALPLVTVDTFLARALSPVERVFGTTLLGTSAIRGINTINQNFSNGNSNTGR